jgi:glycosyltransferase involved in cell wall biosynthesis
MLLKNYTLIISANTKGSNDISNFLAHKSLERNLQACNVEYLNCLGCYNGVEGNSFLITTDKYTLFKAIKKIAFTVYNQQTIITAIKSFDYCYLSTDNSSLKFNNAIIVNKLPLNVKNYTYLTTKKLYIIFN